MQPENKFGDRWGYNFAEEYRKKKLYDYRSAYSQDLIVVKYKKITVSYLCSSSMSTTAFDLGSTAYM